MKQEEMKETLKELRTAGHYIHDILWVTFELNEKETAKVENIRNGVISKYKSVIVDDIPVFKIKKIGKCDGGRSDFNDGSYLYMDCGGNFYWRYVDEWYGYVLPLMPVQGNEDYGVVTQAYVHGKLDKYFRGWGVDIKYFEPEILKDIEGRPVEVGDLVLAAKSIGYRTSAASLIKGVVTKIKPTEVDLDTINHVRSELYILKKHNEV